MITKQLKIAYYVEIIHTVSSLLDEYNQISSNPMEKLSQQKLSDIKKEISSLKKIYNNVFIILLKSGVKFSTNSENWHQSDEIIICINGKNYELTTESAKSILRGEYEKILEDRFFAFPYDNVVESSLEKFTPCLTEENLERKHNSDPGLSVGFQDLLIDVYKIKKADPETNETIEFTIWVTPLDNPENDQFKSPIFALGSAGEIWSAACSMTKDKPLIQLDIGGEVFVIRGSWSEGDFVSLLYPQNVDDQNFRVTDVMKMRPEEKPIIGHKIFRTQDLNFHILPMAASYRTSHRKD